MVDMDNSSLVESLLKNVDHLVIVPVVLCPTVEESVGVWIPDGVPEVGKFVWVGQFRVVVYSLFELSPELSPHSIRSPRKVGKGVAWSYDV